MGTLEEVRNMQTQGMPENQIIQDLQNKGVPYREISNALSQSKIKAAVVEAPPSTQFQNTTQSTMPSTPTPSSTSPTTQQSQQDVSRAFAQSPAAFQPDMLPPNQSDPQSSETYPGMQQSMMPPPSDQIAAQAVTEYTPQTPQAPAEPYPSDQYQDPYYQQDQYSSGEENDPYGYDYQPYEFTPGMESISSETVSEISEQIVSEKLSEIRKKLEKINDFNATIETQTESFEDRLTRIEKMIDNLQSSVLKKVGNYVTNIDDIKKELIQTQKTFSKLVPKLNATSKTKKPKSITKIRSSKKSKK